MQYLTSISKLLINKYNLFKVAKDLDEASLYSVDVYGRDIFPNEKDDDYSFGFRTPAAVVEVIRDASLNAYNEVLKLSQIELMKPEVLLQHLKANIAKESLMKFPVRDAMQKIAKIVAIIPEILAKRPLAYINVMLGDSKVEDNLINKIEKLRSEINANIHGEVSKITDKSYIVFIRGVKTIVKRMILSNSFYNGMKKFIKDSSHPIFNMATWYYGRGQSAAKEMPGKKDEKKIRRIKLYGQDFDIAEDSYNAFMAAPSLEEGIKVLPEYVQNHIKSRQAYDPEKAGYQEGPWEAGVEKQLGQDDKEKLDIKDRVKKLLNLKGK